MAGRPRVLPACRPCGPRRPRGRRTAPSATPGRPCSARLARRRRMGGCRPRRARSTPPAPSRSSPPSGAGRRHASGAGKGPPIRLGPPAPHGGSFFEEGDVGAEAPGDAATRAESRPVAVKIAMAAPPRVPAASTRPSRRSCAGRPPALTEMRGRSRCGTHVGRSASRTRPEAPAPPARRRCASGSRAKAPRRATPAHASAGPTSGAGGSRWMHGRDVAALDDRALRRARSDRRPCSGTGQPASNAARGGARIASVLAANANGRPDRVPVATCFRAWRRAIRAVADPSVRIGVRPPARAGRGRIARAAGHGARFVARGMVRRGRRGPGAKIESRRCRRPRLCNRRQPSSRTRIPRIGGGPAMTVGIETPRFSSAASP